jgi:hypothetical protein
MNELIILSKEEELININTKNPEKEIFNFKYLEFLKDDELKQIAYLDKFKKVFSYSDLIENILYSDKISANLIEVFLQSIINLFNRIRIEGNYLSKNVFNSLKKHALKTGDNSFYNSLLLYVNEEILDEEFDEVFYKKPHIFSSKYKEELINNNSYNRRNYKFSDKFIDKYKYLFPDDLFRKILNENKLNNYLIKKILNNIFNYEKTIFAQVEGHEYGQLAYFLNQRYSDYKLLNLQKRYDFKAYNLVYYIYWTQDISLSTLIKYKPYTDLYFTEMKETKKVTLYKYLNYFKLME